MSLRTKQQIGWTREAVGKEDCGGRLEVEAEGLTESRVTPGVCFGHWLDRGIIS